ncbi:3-keto-disaccharide hydrolase [Tautonia plasticadhaerens]|uniref:3-keto-alpha-glucoside-1,2-lyase/3-keto-2-hydroxy-glucal hydratase domain-containing protein n=1 Tax=Tautonia plasticadhaerens TaxID=2527974 RepID=A0A518GVJ4_9BACT|nr:DUF1080 domain-containing protein [Tautonia plasticadhaerens]QDV32578.1 hypothetical protein ElP_04120 [Tautonia plasticadhaerens]
MLVRSIASVLILFVGAPAAPGPPPGRDEGGWSRLFNGRDLDGWYTFLQEHGKDRDPDGIIAIEDGAIHLYRDVPDGREVVMGYIATEHEYGDYHLRWRYRWGEKKFEPRYALKRDAGLYYHLLGEDAVWPRALQFQVQETDVGDLLALYGLRLDTWIDPETAGEPIPTFLAPDRGGRPSVLGGEGIGYAKRLPGPFEVEGWNTAEVVARGDSTTHVLNGHVVARGDHIRLVDPDRPGESRPISRGRIALEIEAAEIEFRDVEIRMLGEGDGQAPRTDGGG